MRLEGKVTLVTGASRGIGKAIVELFASEGSDIIVNYLKSKNKAEKNVKEIEKMGIKAIAIKADVSKRREVFRMVNYAIGIFSKIDILVNNAGIAWKDNIGMLKTSKEEWLRILNVNLIGIDNCIRAVTPSMIMHKYGKIINLSSSASLGTSTGRQISYSSSKSAVNILTKMFAQKLGEFNININAIAPGQILTDMIKGEKNNKELNEMLSRIAKLNALNRIGQPKDIANIALFLASEESSYITGQIIVADGGRHDFLSHSV